MFIVYTDYTNFVVEMKCFNVTSNNECLNPEVSFWSRNTTTRAEDRSRGEELVRDLCVDQNYYGDTPHSNSRLYVYCYVTLLNSLFIYFWTNI